MQIEHMHNIFYIGGSSASFTNHDRSYRSRESDDLRPAGPVRAPATAGGRPSLRTCQLPCWLPQAPISDSVAAVYASWYSGALQGDSISSRSSRFCHDSWKFKRREADLV